MKTFLIFVDKHGHLIIFQKGLFGKLTKKRDVYEANDSASLALNIKHFAGDANVEYPQYSILRDKQGYGPISKDQQEEITQILL